MMRDKKGRPVGRPQLVEIPRLSGTWWPAACDGVATVGDGHELRATPQVGT